MKKYLTALAAALIFSSAAQANELLLTPSASKDARTTTFAVDYVSDGNAVAFQFTFPLPKGIKPEQVNLRGCAADLPKGFDGQCNVAKGHVIGLFANDQNIPFPAGVIPLGKIVIDGAVAKRLGGIEFLAGDKDAKPIPSSVTVVE